MRLRALDRLRGVAVLLVVLHHVRLPPGADHPLLRTALGLFQRAGWTGVDLFFVLSGFLVAGLLLEEHRRHGSLDLGRFLIRRGLKIYPSFYVLLAVSVAFALRAGRADGTFARHALAEAVYVQNYLPGLWRHTWSLAVEEHFYLLLALVAALLVRRATGAGAGAGAGGGVDPFRPLLLGIPLLGLAVLAARTLLAFGGFADPGALYQRTHLRIDALAWGVLVAVLQSRHPEALARLVTRRKRALVAALVALAALPLLVPARSPFMLSIGLTLLSLGACALVLLALAGRPGGAPMRADPLARIGVDSYSIYLWHLPIQVWVLPLVTASPRFPSGGTGTVAGVAAYVAASLAGGMLLARLVEWPALRFRDRWFPSRGAAARRLGESEMTAADGPRG